MFFQTLKSIFDTFGPAIFVPAVLFIIALIMKVNVKKAFNSALLAGVGLTGFNMLIGAYIPVIVPTVQKMVDITGINLPVIDTGWQASAIVGYSTKIGMIFVGLGLLFQAVLFLLKWTNIFMPGDIWNNYSYMLWGSMLYFVTGNLWLSLGCMLVMNLYTLLFAEVVQKRWSKYYGYPNCTITAPHHIESVPYAIAMDWVLNKLGANKIKLDPENLKKRLGLLGEPMFLGLILGLFLGILGNLKDLGQLASWGEIATVGISTAAVLAIFPKVAGIFASAFQILTDASRGTAKAGGKSREWYLAINDAAGYGEPATLITGIMLIPIILAASFLLPGNKTLPMVDLIALPYMVELIICVGNGNIFKSVISGGIWYAIALYTCSAVAPIFTEVALSTGVSIPAGAALITSFAVIGHPVMGILFFAFLSGNFLIIGGVILLYFVLYFIFQKNRERVHDYLERTAEKESGEVILE
ncbi:MAG: PTS galactitol transporter subunit IIC [Fusobacteriales bacterium]|jgi:PTS system galactitol-specific IIC component|nr:PTS galactitol transporter subunit IIC [Fusobacteriales bacterium]